MWADSIQNLDYIQLIYDKSVTTQNLAFLSYWYRKKLTFMWQCIVTNFFLIKPKDALISQIYFFFQETLQFRAVPLPIVRRFPLYIRRWYMSCRFVDSFQTRPGWNCNFILVVHESCHQTCMTYTSAECTVKISWRWAEELPETCRVSWQNKFGKLVRLLVLLKKNR